MQQILINIWETLQFFTIMDFFDILIVTILAYQLLKLTGQTRANQVIRGLGVLFLLAQISQWLNMPAMSWLLRYLLDAGAIMLVILFQPELRNALEKLGRNIPLERMQQQTTGDIDGIPEAISIAVQNMAKDRVGALIVIKKKSQLGDVMESGTVLNASVSTELIENIFVPGAPLHDGAMIIIDDSISSAGCVLPTTTDPDLSSDLGMRHRAALGLSEISDALIIIVSEETGIISVAEDGKLIRYLDSVALNGMLRKIYDIKQTQQGLNGILKRKPKNEK